MQEGEPSPITGFALTVDGYETSLANQSEIRRWVVEALARLQEYEKRTVPEQDADATE